MERLEQLIALYLDGVLSPAEERELAERVRADRDVARIFHTFYQQDRLLNEMHQPESLEPVKAIMDEIAQAERAFVGMVMDTVRTESNRVTRPTFVSIGERLLSLWRPSLALAACALLGVGVWIFLFGAKVGEPTLVVDTNARATLLRAGQNLPATDGVKLRANDVLVVTGTNAITITYRPENTNVKLEPGSTLKQLAARGKRFELRTGKLEADVARQRPFRPMVVLTSEAEARVIGTKFTLSKTPGATRLDVDEGEVRLTRPGDQERIDVPAEHYAIVAANVELAALPKTGSILREYWTNLPGTNVDTGLTLHPLFPDRPSGREWATSFETPSNWGDDYGARWRGFLHPPMSGEYRLALDAVDDGQLYLSPEAAPEKKIVIWRSGAESREGLNSNSPVSLFTLKAGRQYYIEVTHKAGKGRDHLSVSWKRPDGKIEIIPGDCLSPFAAKPKEKKP